MFEVGKGVLIIIVVVALIVDVVGGLVRAVLGVVVEGDGSGFDVGERGCGGGDDGGHGEQNRIEVFICHIYITVQ